MNVYEYEVFLCVDACYLLGYSTTYNFDLIFRYIFHLFSFLFRFSVVVVAAAAFMSLLLIYYYGDMVTNFIGFIFWSNDDYHKA